MYIILCFFFQAEDGIRDRNVTGVQTCALPILGWPAANTNFLFGVRDKLLPPRERGFPKPRMGKQNSSLTSQRTTPRPLLTRRFPFNLPEQKKAESRQKSKLHRPGEYRLLDLTGDVYWQERRQNQFLVTARLLGQLVGPPGFEPGTNGL